MCNVIKLILAVQAMLHHCINTIFFIVFVVPRMPCNLFFFSWSQLHTNCHFALMLISHTRVTLTHVRWIDSSFACFIINLFLWPVFITLNLSILIFICLYTWLLHLNGDFSVSTSMSTQISLHNYVNILLLKGPKPSEKTTACSAFVRRISSEVYSPIIWPY